MLQADQFASNFEMQLDFRDEVGKYGVRACMQRASGTMVASGRVRGGQARRACVHAEGKWENGGMWSGEGWGSTTCVQLPSVGSFRAVSESMRRTQR